MALSDEYSKRVVIGRQRKHIPGTKEFEQHRKAMQARNPGSEPSILTADADELVKMYAGKGVRISSDLSQYPREEIDTGAVVGKTWVKSLQKYVDTKRIRIIYSSTGVHIVPVSDYQKGALWKS